MAPSRGCQLIQTWPGVAANQGSFGIQIVVCRRFSPPLRTLLACPNHLQSSRHARLHPLRGLQTHSMMRNSTVAARRSYSSFTEKLSDPTSKLQSYVSRSSDPYLNLSIEDHILRKSPADSTVLFLYVNRPCVVIGRNQNPWSEVNLAILDAARGASTPAPKDTEPPGIGTVDIVRRRSGGGTVFHDEGNLNWSITCPRDAFTRDKHAEMTVRALRKLGIDRARVNERHDIVLDQGHTRRSSDPRDTYRTPYTVDDGMLPRPLKVSGSAYKLTRQRALHHATTLLSSPNLHIIPQYLRSPAKKFIQAKGVESVSSPVGNIGLDVSRFQQCLQEEFAAMYAELGTPSVVQSVGDELRHVPDIQKGYDELRTENWMWSQTPQFHLLLKPDNDIGLELDVHHGIIKSLEFKGNRFPKAIQEDLRSVLVNQKLQDIRGWQLFLRHRLKTWDNRGAAIATRLDELIPIPQFTASQC